MFFQRNQLILAATLSSLLVCPAMASTQKIEWERADNQCNPFLMASECAALRAKLTALEPGSKRARVLDECMQTVRERESACNTGNFRDAVVYWRSAKR